jgi:formylglycine-generating enzyme required for sulfatase activity
MTITSNLPPELAYKEEKRTASFFHELLRAGLMLKMMVIPGGSFLMGSPPDELQRSENEGPQYEVTVPTFCMGKYPVTQAQWLFVAELPQVDQTLEADPSYFKDDLYPVEQVSWWDALEFCARLSVYAQRPYRLPSEAEWEYACRAGTTTPFHFGPTVTTSLANYRGTDEKNNRSGSYGPGPKGEYRATTTTVDQFGAPNAFGLCDMHGNVWEWCEDHWHDSYDDAHTDGSAWLDENAEEDSSKVLRGGSWNDEPLDCRSAFRYHDLAREAYSYIGFRVVVCAPMILS